MTDGSDSDLRLHRSTSLPAPGDPARPSPSGSGRGPGDGATLRGFAVPFIKKAISGPTPGRQFEFGHPAPERRPARLSITPSVETGGLRRRMLGAEAAVSFAGAMPTRQGNEGALVL